MKFKRKNAERLRDFIASEKYEFDMGEMYPRPRCGTAGCIGGHAAVLWRDVRTAVVGGDYSFCDGTLAHKLGISYDAVRSLCWEPRTRAGHELQYERVTRAMAIAALNDLIANNGERVRFPSPRKRNASAPGGSR
jgi:hypothetical protein